MWDIFGKAEANVKYGWNRKIKLNFAHDQNLWMLFEIMYVDSAKQSKSHVTASNFDWLLILILASNLES